MIPILFRPEADPEALIDVNSIPLQDVDAVELLASGDKTAARLFDNFGLGVLTDCITCEVTEERNGEYELFMQYPITGVHYNEIEHRAVILAKPNFADEPQAFRIYKVNALISGVAEIYAAHITYDLSGVPVSPFTATSAGAACAGLLSHALIQTPFSIGTTVSTIADFKVDYPTSVRSLFGGKEGSLLDVYGGEWHYDNYTATLMSARGQNRGVVIRYGKNLVDLRQETNLENLYTGVLPYWKNETTGEYVEANIINIAGSFGYRRILVLDLSLEFEAKPTVAQVTARANTYITANNIGKPSVNITLDWAQVGELTDRVDLCDTVTVIFEKLGVEVTSKCISATWDVLAERYKELEIGDATANMASTIVGLQEKEKTLSTSVSAPMLRAIANATALITGNEGGYVVMHDGDGDGYPDELLIMDSDSVETATKVWRWNKSGLGYSSTGYNGSYGLAMTADGSIVADFITTGSLNADRINGGTITGVQINNGSGTFQVDENGNVTANSLSSSNATITGGSIVINSANLGQVIKLVNSAAPAYHKIGPNTEWAGNTDGSTSQTTWYRLFSGGNISISGTLSQGSDRRKKDILGDDVPDLSKVRAVRFKWNDGRDELEHIGYIAQDIEKLAPNMVTDIEGTKALDYIQVLVAKVERLERELAKLKGGN